MKSFIGFLFVLVVLVNFNCKNSNRKKLQPPLNSSIATHEKKIIDSNEQLIEDTFTNNNNDVAISLERDDTFYYSKEQFKIISKHFSDLNKFYTVRPDLAYASGKIIQYSNSETKKYGISFNSEYGQDAYYTLYAYFLRLENRNSQINERRNTIIELYRQINELNSNLYYGGTYYGHQYRRILGYAEYSLYHYLANKDRYDKKFDINDQKKLFVKGLKQLVRDEISVDEEIFDIKQKENRKKELFKIVEGIDKLITDYFYLRSAEEFQYSNY